MSETILTKGWPKPTGKCDMCESRPAAHWFGDTSVALCGDSFCARVCQEKWDEMVKESDEAASDW